MLGTRTLSAGPIAVMILARLPDQYPRRYINRRAKIPSVVHIVRCQGAEDGIATLIATADCCEQG